MMLFMNADISFGFLHLAHFMWDILSKVVKFPVKQSTSVANQAHLYQFHIANLS